MEIEGAPQSLPCTALLSGRNSSSCFRPHASSPPLLPKISGTCVQPHTSKLPSAHQKCLFLSVSQDPYFLPTAAGAGAAMAPWPAVPLDPFHADWPHWDTATEHPQPPPPWTSRGASLPDQRNCAGQQIVQFKVPPTSMGSFLTFAAAQGGEAKSAESACGRWPVAGVAATPC